MANVAPSRDLVAGLVLAALGGVTLWSVSELTMGTALRMGPGYVPRALGAILICLGLAISAAAFLGKDARLERWSLRPLLVVITCPLLFALVIGRGGLALTAFLLVLSAGLASSATNWRRQALIAFLAAIAAILIFAVALDLPFDIWPALR